MINLNLLFPNFCHLSLNFDFYQAEFFDVYMVILSVFLLWLLDFVFLFGKN